MPQQKTQAIASVITAPGEGGIGIIALIGEGAAAMLDRFFEGTRRSARELEPGVLAHGRIKSGCQTLDEVIVCRLPGATGSAGSSHYEVNCHGGAIAVRSVLRCFENAGARAVPWKELQSLCPEGGRSFQTEVRRRAIRLLPHARTRLAVKMLLHQAAGALAAELEAIREALSRGEDSAARSKLESLLGTAALGTALLEPPKAAIVGPPNVGKSTLLNALLRKERVIVHEQPGTTRDVVSEVVSIRGVPFELMDSAGIRRPEGAVEADAVRRAQELMARCDVAMLLFDAREGPEPSLGVLSPSCRGKRIILVGNKIDLLDATPSPAALPEPVSTARQVFISAKEGMGIDALEAALLEPYAAWIRRCEQGGPFLFDRETQAAVRQVADALEREGCTGALAAAEKLTPAPQA